MESQAEVRCLTACVEGRDTEMDALWRSKLESRSYLASFDGRRSDYVSAGVLLEKPGASDMLLSDPARSFWRSLRDKAIEELVSSFMAEINDTMAQVDSATSSLFSWVSQLA